MEEGLVGVKSPRRRRQTYRLDQLVYTLSALYSHSQIKFTYNINSQTIASEALSSRLPYIMSCCSPIEDGMEAAHKIYRSVLISILLCFVLHLVFSRCVGQEDAVVVMRLMRCVDGKLTADVDHFDSVNGRWRVYTCYIDGISTCYLCQVRSNESDHA